MHADRKIGRTNRAAQLRGQLRGVDEPAQGEVQLRAGIARIVRRIDACQPQRHPARKGQCLADRRRDVDPQIEGPAGDIDRTDARVGQRIVAIERGGSDSQPAGQQLHILGVEQQLARAKTIVQLRADLQTTDTQRQAGQRQQRRLAD